MKDTKTIVLAVLVLAVLSAGVYFLAEKGNTPVSEPVPTEQTSVISGDTGNLVSLSVSAGQTLSGSVVITGALKGAYFFEANARGMLLDATKTIVQQFPIGATSEDWMTIEAVPFSATVDVSPVLKGPGYLRIANDNPSGDPVNDRFIDVPVVFN